MLLLTCLYTHYHEKAVRADESLSSLPVILLSARSNEAHKVLALERGADDYITKPFSSKELYARVKVGSNIYHFSNSILLINFLLQGILERNELRVSVAREREDNRAKVLLLFANEIFFFD